MKGKMRFTALLLTLVMIMGLLAGCKKNASDSANNNSNTGGEQKKTEEQQAKQDNKEQETVTIEWWTPNWDEKESREMVEEFTAMHPNIKVNLVITEWDTYKSKITAAISTKNAPQLYTVLTTDIAQFGKLGLLSPLNDLGAQAGINFDDILKGALDICTVNGNIYGIPFRHDGSGVWYNVDMLKAAGYTSFPATWAEMNELSAKIKENNIAEYAHAWPLGNQANAATRMVQQLYSLGGNVLNDAETECLLDSKEAIQALTNICETLEKGYASPSSLEMDNTILRDTFGAGKLAFYIGGPFDASTLETEYPNINFASAVIPGENGMGCTTSNGWSIGMAANTEHKEEAALFLQYLTTPENQARLTDSFPASYTAIQYEQFATDNLKPFAAQLENSKPEPAYAQWAQMEPIIFNYMQYALSGTMTPEEACKAMKTDIDALLN
jgi:multiple sugar transport system substrate-binding protein